MRRGQSGRWRGVVLGGLALACQVFAGHLQDALLTIGLVGLYGLYRAATERGLAGAALRAGHGGRPGRAGRLDLGRAVGAVQGAARSLAAAGGLSWDDLTYGSWHPELLPTLVVREAYGTRARDTDWMDGYYPYHEMNTYMGLIAIVLAVVGAGGAAGARPLVELLGLADRDRRRADAGQVHVPVRLCASDPDSGQLARAGAVSPLGVAGSGRAGGRRRRAARAARRRLAPRRADPGRRARRALDPDHDLHLCPGLDRAEALDPAVSPRPIPLAGPRAVDRHDPDRRSWRCWPGGSRGGRRGQPTRLAARGWAAILPLLVMADLLGAHWVDVPTVDPRYWTEPPESARRLKAEPELDPRLRHGRQSTRASRGMPRNAIDFLAVRDPLDWSLPLVWHLTASKGNTPMISRRSVDFTDHASSASSRFDLEGDSHIVTGRTLHAEDLPAAEASAVGAAFIHRNSRRAAAGSAGRASRSTPTISCQAIAALDRLARSRQLRDHLVVEDPDASARRPTPTVSGTARIVEDLPERVVVETDAATPAYLVLSDTFDPGWSATVDGQPAPIRPAYVAFRAVYLPQGKHTVVFTYRPAGFELGLRAQRLRDLAGARALVLATASVATRARTRGLELAVALADLVVRGPGGDRADLGGRDRPRRTVALQSRWKNSVHPFTWGSGIWRCDATGQAEVHDLPAVGHAGVELLAHR